MTIAKTKQNYIDDFEKHMNDVCPFCKKKFIYGDRGKKVARMIFDLYLFNCDNKYSSSIPFQQILHIFIIQLKKAPIDFDFGCALEVHKNTLLKYRKIIKDNKIFVKVYNNLVKLKLKSSKFRYLNYDSKSVYNTNGTREFVAIGGEYKKKASLKLSFVQYIDIVTGKNEIILTSIHKGNVHDSNIFE